MPPERIILSRERLAKAVGDRWSESELNEAVALLTRADGRFPAGVRTLAPELVRAVQRERLLAAMTRAVTEIGYNALTVQNVLGPAGISRPTFYEQFEDKEDCFLAAFEVAAAELRKEIKGAVEAAAGSDWREKLRAGIAALLGFIVAEPETARLVIVEARASSAVGLLRRDELLDDFATCIDDLVRDGLEKPVSALAAAGIVGGIESVIYARVQKGETEDMEALLPSLMYFAVLTCAGQAAAAEELDRAALA